MPGVGRIGDLSRVTGDAHWCMACPHTAVGPAVTGSPTVFVNGLPALRVDDIGVHAACCGPNMWRATTGSSTVFFDKKPAHRQGDQDLHCNTTVGSLIQGSPDVIVGE